MNANTTSKHSTHFLRGVDLIYEGVEKYGIPSENWPYPTKYRLGDPLVDRYYAEVWVNGMDWQPSYWVIETDNYNEPIVYPFIIFNENEDRSKFNSSDFEDLIESCLWFRRNELWISHHPDNSVYNDTVWPFLYINPNSQRFNYEFLRDGYFEHGSQKKVDFVINSSYVPRRCKSEEHWNNRNKKTGHVGSLSESIRPVS